MCEFLSWIELPNGELKYISDFELGTRDGIKLKKFLGERYSNEIVGHGAIKTYFGLKHGVGKDCECIDFSTPDNFPDEIVQKIKAGKFSQLGINRQLLSHSAKEEYLKVVDPAWKEYRKVVNSAWEEHKKAEGLAWKEYNKVKVPAWKKYKKAERLAFWKLFVNPKNRSKKWR